MIPNPIYYIDNPLMTGIIACCLIVFTAVMIPKAMRHRRRVRESKREKAVGAGEQELQMIIAPDEETVFEQSMSDYKSRFLTNTDLSAGKGQLVGIRKKYHNRISKIVKNIGENDVTVFSYMDNVLKHHFETFQDDISGLYKRNCDDDYLIPKK